MLCAVCCILSVHAGVIATVQAFCYNRNAPTSNELYRRFWVGTIPELLQKVDQSGTVTAP